MIEEIFHKKCDGTHPNLKKWSVRLTSPISIASSEKGQTRPLNPHKSTKTKTSTSLSSPLNDPGQDMKSCNFMKAQSNCMTTTWLTTCVGVVHCEYTITNNHIAGIYELNTLVTSDLSPSVYLSLSGLHGTISCSILVGGVPNPYHRLKYSYAMSLLVYLWYIIPASSYIHLFGIRIICLLQPPPPPPLLLLNAHDVNTPLFPPPRPHPRSRPPHRLQAHIKIFLVDMYWATVFYPLETYVSIYSNPTSLVDSLNGC